MKANYQSLWESFVCVIPWYLSLLIFWIRESVDLRQLMISLFSPNEMIVTAFFLLFCPGISIYVCQLRRREKAPQFANNYNISTIIVGVVVGTLGSLLWFGNFQRSIDTFVFVLGLVLILMWKLLWDGVVARLKFN